MPVVFKASIFIYPLTGGRENNVRASGKFSSLWAQLSSLDQKGKKTSQIFHSKNAKSSIHSFNKMYCV